MPEGVSHSGAFVTYRRCRDLVDGLDPTNSTLRSVASTAYACHIDSAHLCRLFRRFARTTQYRHLIRRRLEAGTDRFSRPDCLVKEMAEEFGFADAYHFSGACQFCILLRAKGMFNTRPPCTFGRRPKATALRAKAGRHSARVVRSGIGPMPATG